jgi:hypothetical protein
VFVTWGESSVRFALTMPKSPRVPIFVLDSHEKFQPLAVESVEKAPATLVGLDGKEHGKVALEALPAEGGRMNFPPDPEAQEKRLRPDLGGVGYRRELVAAGLTWIQYWLWYLYNPKRVAGAGVHEGDWEFVQVGYGGETPVCVTVSRHQTAGARLWWEIERDDGRPVIYVARDSHAHYFEPVEEEFIWEDEADGKGERLDELEWRPFGDWATWPGLWGNSTGVGRSPQSPGSQGNRWNAPHRYHSSGAR